MNMKKLLVLILIVLTVFSCISCSSGKIDAKEELNDIVDFLYEQSGVEKGQLLSSDEFLMPGDSISDWIAILLSKADTDEDSAEYLKRLEEYVETKYSGEEKLHRIKATEWHRIGLTVLALGGDPMSFGTDSKGQAINLVKDGTFGWTQTDDICSQGNNAVIFALILLEASDCDVPEGSKYTKEKLICDLLAGQSEDGGFGLSKSAGVDLDITAMAVQALAPYYGESENYSIGGKMVTVKQSVDKALEFLSNAQAENGAYKYGDSYSCETSAQIILALCTLGIDPSEDERFEKNGTDIVEGLRIFKCKDGGYSHVTCEEAGDRGDVMASEQAGRAFAALMLLDEGKSYYDFK